MKNTKHIAVIGRNGFIGSALTRYLTVNGFEVSSFPTEKTSILFHLGSPVHPPFEENPEYHMQEILSSFMYLLPYCRDHGIKFVYPSSALVYEKDTMFAKCKKIMEMYASCYPDTLGLRIFPVYGPGEHRTAIAQWCEAMRKGERPVIYGDGTQERDFIYIDDVINQIIKLIFVDDATGVHDVGAGNPVAFNAIVEAINKALGTKIEPEYVPQPQNYSKGIVCQDPGIINVEIDEGVKKTLLAFDYPLREVKT